MEVYVKFILHIYAGSNHTSFNRQASAHTVNINQNGVLFLSERMTYKETVLTLRCFAGI